MFLGKLGYYAALLLLVAIEGQVAMLIGAGAAASGFLNLYIVFAVAALGNVLSDLAWYGLGYFLRPETLIHHFQRWGLTQSRLQSLEALLQRNLNRLLLFAKFTNWMTIPTLVALGSLRIPMRRFFLLILLGNLIIAAIVVPLGYFATASFLKIQQGMMFVALGATFVLLFFAFLYGRRWLSHQKFMAGVDDLPSE